MSSKKILEMKRAIEKVNESFLPLKDQAVKTLEDSLTVFQAQYEQLVLDKIRYSLEDLGYIFSDEDSFTKFLIANVKRVVDEQNLTVYYLLGYKSVNDLGEILAESNELKINVTFGENEVFINVG